MREDLEMWRDSNGVVHIEASDKKALWWGFGYAHARDRGVQLLLQRILGQGRGSELLDNSEEMLGIDKFFRKMNWSGHVDKELAALPKDKLPVLQAYCDGINAAFAKKAPWECKLLGFRPEPWKIEDTILISRMMGYIALAQSQGEIERLFVELVQANISIELLEPLFPGLLEGLEPELIKKVTLEERIVQPESLWGQGVARMMASNNWVISGEKTASGKPILSNDPHLEVNRLPNVWYELCLKMGDDYLMGGSIPGLPGVVVGRNASVAWGATYTFLDGIDSWIQQCKDGKFRRGEDDWEAFQVRKEVIKRKKKAPVEVTFYESQHGVLEGNPYEEGYYLSTRWASAQTGALSLCAALDIWDAKDAESAMDCLGEIETAWNFVFADVHGSIGYQMSGLMPKRKEGWRGFIPVPGWEAENDWKGFHHHRDLPRSLNPEQGFFVTANEDLNPHGKEKPINMPMGMYRSHRIAALLKESDDWKPEDVFRMHFDVYSLQAEAFMKILRPLLPNTPQGELLKTWDCSYDLHSNGPYLFEQFYAELRREVIGQVVGLNAVDYLQKESGIFIDFYENIDRILLAESSPWFGEETRDALFHRVAVKALKTPPRKWGDVQKLDLANILLGGKLPKFLGFDRGPISIPGGRATVHQGQIYRSAGRQTSFAPSFRIVTDLSTNECHSNMAGGPSDRRFSKWYCSDLQNWCKGIYKRLQLAPEGNRFKVD